MDPATDPADFLSDRLKISEEKIASLSQELQTIIESTFVPVPELNLDCPNVPGDLDCIANHELSKRPADNLAHYTIHVLLTEQAHPPLCQFLERLADLYPFRSKKRSVAILAL